MLKNRDIDNRNTPKLDGKMCWRGTNEEVARIKNLKFKDSWMENTEEEFSFAVGVNEKKKPDLSERQLTSRNSSLFSPTSSLFSPKSSLFSPTKMMELSNSTMTTSKSKNSLRIPGFSVMDCNGRGTSKPKYPVKPKHRMMSNKPASPTQLVFMSNEEKEKEDHYRDRKKNQSSPKTTDEQQSPLLKRTKCNPISKLGRLNEVTENQTYSSRKVVNWDLKGHDLPVRRRQSLRLAMAKEGTRDEPMSLLSSDDDECHSKEKKDEDQIQLGFPCHEIYIGTQKRSGKGLRVTFEEEHILLCLPFDIKHGVPRQEKIPYSSIIECHFYIEDDVDLEEEKWQCGSFIALSTTDASFCNNFRNYYGHNALDSKENFVLFRAKESKQLVEPLKKLQECVTLTDKIEKQYKGKYLSAVREETIAQRTRSGGTQGKNHEDMTTILTYPLPPCTTDLITITRSDLMRLEPGEFLNDNIVDYYFRKLHQVKYSMETFPLHNQILFFSSYFFTRLTEGKGVTIEKKILDGLENIKTWTLKSDVFEKQVLFFPINHRKHWSLAILCNPLGVMEEESKHPTCLIVMDSLAYHKRGRIWRYLSSFLQHEWNRRSATLQDLPVQDYPIKKIQVVSPKAPQQKNGYDCGVYLLEYAECFLAGYHRITQSDIDNNIEWIHPSLFSSADITKKRSDILLDIKEEATFYQASLSQNSHTL